MSICSVMAANMILHYRHQCAVILGLQHSVENNTHQFSFRIFDPCSRCLCDQLTGKRLDVCSRDICHIAFSCNVKEYTVEYIFVLQQGVEDIAEITGRVMCFWRSPASLRNNSDIITHAGPGRYQPSLDCFLNTIKNQLRASHRYTNPQLFKVYFFCFACVLSLMYLWCVCCSSIIISFFYLLTFFNQAL